MSPDAEGQPLDVEVINGEVVITGPRVAVALAIGAAAETARRLMAASREVEKTSPVTTGTASNDT